MGKYRKKLWTVKSNFIGSIRKMNYEKFYDSIYENFVENRISEEIIGIFL